MYFKSIFALAVAAATMLAVGAAPAVDVTEVNTYLAF